MKKKELQAQQQQLAKEGVEPGGSLVVGDLAELGVGTTQLVLPAASLASSAPADPQCGNGVALGAGGVCGRPPGSDTSSTALVAGSSSPASREPTRPPARCSECGRWRPTVRKLGVCEGCYKNALS